MDRTHIHHLVLLPPNWIGDAVMSQPAMRAIIDHYKQNHGTEKISVCGRAWLQELLPYMGLSGAIYRQQIPGADVAFLFPNSFRSALQCKLAGIRHIIGYRGQWRRPLLKRSFPHRISLRKAHHRDFYLDLARQCDIPVAETGVTLHIPDHARMPGRKLLQGHDLDPERIICIAPGAQFGGAKCYPAEAYNQVVHELADSGWQPLILGMPEDRKTGQMILHNIPTPHWNAAGETSLTEALQLIVCCHLMLCNDSGLMHVAAGLGIPTVVPFGATDPARTSPSGGQVRVLYEPSDCSPCLKRECVVAGHPCMTNISPASLLKSCQGMLAASKNTRT